MILFQTLSLISYRCLWHQKGEPPPVLAGFDKIKLLYQRSGLSKSSTLNMELD